MGYALFCKSTNKLLGYCKIQVLENMNQEAIACKKPTFVYPFNSLPNDKILDWSKLKAFADDKINITEKLKFV